MSEGTSRSSEAESRPAGGAGARWTERRHLLLALAIVSAAYWAPLPLVGIAGEFPLNDDWAYARGVESLLGDGHIERPDWAWAPAVPNILWGALFSGALGESFESLRWSTLFAGYLGVVAAFALARQLRLGTIAAVAVALTLAWNPIHLNLAFTFMTDVLFTTLVTLGLLLLAAGWEGRADRGWDRARIGWLAGGLALAAAAALSRNAGPALAIALAIAVAIDRIRSLRSLGLVAVVGGPLVIAAVAWLITQRGPVGVLPQLGWVLHERFLSEHTPYFLARSSIAVLPILGACAAPVLPFVLSGARLGRRLALAAIATLAVFALAWRLGQTPPFSLNILWDLGVGARTLPGRELLPAVPLLTGALTALGCFCGALGLIEIAGARGREWKALRERRRSARGRQLIALFVLCYLGPLMFQGPFFDRWLLAVAAPFAILVLVSSDGVRVTRVRLAASASVLLLFFLLGTAGTHDMMNRHRARWALLGELLDRGVPAERIDGGFEFNGYTKYDPALPPGIGAAAWIGDGEYRLSYAADLPGYERVAERGYRRWLPPGEETITVHRRSE